MKYYAAFSGSTSVRKDGDTPKEAAFFTCRSAIRQWERSARVTQNRRSIDRKQSKRVGMRILAPHLRLRVMKRRQAERRRRLRVLCLQQFKFRDDSLLFLKLVRLGPKGLEESEDEGHSQYSDELSYTSDPEDYTCSTSSRAIESMTLQSELKLLSNELILRISTLNLS
eukprot:TRINITY_DN685_c0_g1_i1.p1 TRINITY_DN685_c0_g1~~TRINITY_DN685_c0_g1_i1.p1  ORF type:complete len:169 (-),score=26.98 TRINITY_DN685_c0_g1_i1:112-618(-)